ncbi:hypothetical protein GCM10022247_56750 [Allokutzneria multivorans]|uniref:Uncharacterized protein n=1 Tax=Allokutzneria multivorans TaxID=1142134 RepID=A0ABP7TE69_9PSEU
MNPATDELRSLATDTAARLRAVLAEVATGVLACPAGARNRLEGAALALDALGSGEPATALATRLINDRLRDDPA